MAAASDFFKQLSAGVRFDRKRPESRIARAQSSKSAASAQAHVIDFFNEAVRETAPGDKGHGQSALSRPRSDDCDVEGGAEASIGDISVFRKAMRIHAKGDSIADPVGRFADLQVFPAQRSAIASFKFILLMPCSAKCGRAEVDAVEYRGNAMERADARPDAGRRSHVFGATMRLFAKRYSYQRTPASMSRF